MSKQLKPNEWIELFNLYESNNCINLWTEYAKYRTVTNSTKWWFKQKYKKFLYHNKDMNSLISMTGKTTKHGNKVGRPKNTQDKHEIWKEFLQEIGYDELSNLISELVDNGDEKLIEKLKEITKKSKLSSRKMSSILNVSKSTICNIRNYQFPNIIQPKKSNWLYEKIIDTFNWLKGRRGRKGVAEYINKEGRIKISDRQVGRIMNKLGLFCNIRIAKKIKELKDTKVDINNLVLRDYDNKNHEHEIIATDVTYLPGTFDAKQNHLYLSVTISHKTKEILGAKLSMNNDTNLVIDSFKSIKDKPINAIVHSDHGKCYSSSEFIKMLKEFNWKQSMSRVGNSLDNRVVEFWFSILKTELIYKLNIKQMTFNELENEINDFIHYYNNVRIQEKLNWMTPTQYRNHL